MMSDERHIKYLQKLTRTLQGENAHLRNSLRRIKSEVSLRKTLATRIYSDSGASSGDETVIATVWQNKDGIKYMHFFYPPQPIKEIGAGNAEEWLPPFFRRHPAPSAN